MIENINPMFAHGSPGVWIAGAVILTVNIWLVARLIAWLIKRNRTDDRK